MFVHGLGYFLKSVTFKPEGTTRSLVDHIDFLIYSAATNGPAFIPAQKSGSGPPGGRFIPGRQNKLLGVLLCTKLPLRQMPGVSVATLQPLVLV